LFCLRAQRTIAFSPSTRRRRRAGSIKTAASGGILDWDFTTGCGTGLHVATSRVRAQEQAQLRAVI
jgi:hypothetical protein